MKENSNAGVSRGLDQRHPGGSVLVGPVAAGGGMTAPGRWQTMESAPKDGSRVLMYWPQFPFRGADGDSRHIECAQWCADSHGTRPRPYWRGDCERVFGVLTYRNSEPTHWQPLENPGVLPKHAITGEPVIPGVCGMPDCAECEKAKSIRAAAGVDDDAQLRAVIAANCATLVAQWHTGVKSPDMWMAAAAGTLAAAQALLTKDADG